MATVTRAYAYASETLNAPVEVLGSLDVPMNGRVRVVTLGGGTGGWRSAGKELMVDRAILRDVRTRPAPWRSREAHRAAYLGMCRTAGRMNPNYDANGRPAESLRRTDPVAYWDLVASMNDYRAALCLSDGVPLEDISREGYRVQTPDARAFLAARRKEHGARL